MCRIGFHGIPDGLRSRLLHISCITIFGIEPEKHPCDPFLRHSRYAAGRRLVDCDTLFILSLQHPLLYIGRDHKPTVRFFQQHKLFCLFPVFTESKTQHTVRRLFLQRSNDVTAPTALLRTDRRHRAAARTAFQQPHRAARNRNQQQQADIGRLP